MKLSCAQEALADALTMVGRVVPGKATLPILTNVLLEADATGALRLTATNLELTVSRRIRGAVQSEGRTTVPARLLAEYVGLLDSGKQVSIQLNPSASKLPLACERFEANIATLPAERSGGGREPPCPGGPRRSRLVSKIFVSGGWPHLTLLLQDVLGGLPPGSTLLQVLEEHRDWIRGPSLAGGHLIGCRDEQAT